MARRKGCVSNEKEDTMKRSICLAVTLVATLASSAVPAAAPPKAEQFPQRPVRFIIPYQPGGATDTTARPLAEGLRQLWGQPVIVDNRPGASVNIALELSGSSAPLGYTLFVDGSIEAELPDGTLRFASINELRAHLEKTG